MGMIGPTGGSTGHRRQAEERLMNQIGKAFLQGLATVLPVT